MHRWKAEQSLVVPSRPFVQFIASSRHTQSSQPRPVPATGNGRSYTHRERERGLRADYHQAGLASVSVDDEEVDQITMPIIKTSRVMTAPPVRYMFLTCPAGYTHQYRVRIVGARAKSQPYSARLLGEPLHHSALSMPFVPAAVVVLLSAVAIIAMTCIAVAAFVSAGGAGPVARACPLAMSVFLARAGAPRLLFRPRRRIISAAATFICSVRFVAVVRRRIGV